MINIIKKRNKKNKIGGNKMKPESAFKGGIGLLVLFFVVVFIVMLGVDKVDADKVGVMDRFGNVLGRMDSGLRWTGLFVGVTQYPMTIQKITLERIEAVDRGAQAVFATIIVNYKIKNPDVPVAMYQEVATTGKMNIIEERLALREKIQEAFKQVSVQYEAVEIFENRDEVRTKTIERINNLFPKEYFEIISITVQNIDFAPSFNAAIQLKKDNTQLALAAVEKVKQSEAEANQAIEKARGKAEAKKLDADAIAYALKAQRLEISDQLIQKMWIEAWDGGVPTYMMGGMDTSLLLQIPTVE